MFDFIPSSDAALVTWATTLKTKIETTGRELGLSDADITKVKDWCDGIINSVSNYLVAKTTSDRALSTKKQVVATSIVAARNFAKDVKRNNAYTEAIGAELGIVGSSTTFDASNYKPTLKAESHPGYVLLKFVKKGAEGVAIYSRKRGEAEWVKISNFLHSPCTDSRPLEVEGQAENREYMCIGIKNDHQIGHQSDIVSVAYAG